VLSTSLPFKRFEPDHCMSCSRGGSEAVSVFPLPAARVFDFERNLP
jgi:hypothetical protein